MKIAVCVRGASPRVAAKRLFVTDDLQMRLFSCPSCSQVLYFENIKCERCQHPLGYWPETSVMGALEPAPDSTGDTWVAIGVEGKTLRQCANAKYDVCNWMVDASTDEEYCAACSHNRVVPEVSSEENRLAWRKIESAKHRLFYTLNKLNIAGVIGVADGPEPLAFQFMADYPDTSGPKVMTGHENGTITIALAEADDAEREQRRQQMGEPYRTLLGHFRHEVGHFYWDKLVRDGGELESCRAVFGNDEEDYQEALNRHYQNGAPIDWQQHYVSSYATMHPWEDFAETWAHYLHIIDTLEMAQAFGMTLAPSVDDTGKITVKQPIDPYAADDINKLIDVWLPVSMALNSLNRTMGKEEVYPFILSAPVIAKLGYMHELLRKAATRQ